jgi:hypothetical protein
MVLGMSVGDVPARLWSSTRHATSEKTELVTYEYGYLVATRYEWTAWEVEANFWLIYRGANSEGEEDWKD